MPPGQDTRAARAPDKVCRGGQTCCGILAEKAKPHLAELQEAVAVRATPLVTSQRGGEDSLYYFGTFSVSLKLVQGKTLKKKCPGLDDSLHCL